MNAEVKRKIEPMVNRVNRVRGNDKAKKSGFVYKERSPESVKQRAEQSGGGYESPFKSGLATWRPQDGDNTIRFLPPTWEDANHFAYEVYVHEFIGANNGTFLCNAKMKRGKCPICEEQKEAATAGEDEDAKALLAKKKNVAWILDREEEDFLPKLYMFSWTIDRDIAAVCYNKRSGKTLALDHPEVGFNLAFKKQGKGLNTRYYGYQIDRDPSALSEDDDQAQEIMTFIEENSVPDSLVFRSYDYIKREMTGTVEEEDDDVVDDSEEEPTSRTLKRDGTEAEGEDEEIESDRKKASAKKRRDPDEEETVEEEEEEKPRKKARKDPEEVEEEVEEDDPPPKAKTKRTRVVEEEEPEEEEEKPAKKVLAKKKRPDPEEEEEEPPFEEDERPKSKKTARREEPEEEEEIVEEEEEEVEEERPTRRRR
jgi:hypothetical protein